MNRMRCIAGFAAFVTVVATHGATADVVHQVHQGDTLASIAQRYYGDPSREATLEAANVLNAQANASLLPGMRIVVPSVTYYRVIAGDTWERIAVRELGSGSRAQYLALINRANLLALPSPGAVLRVPYLLRYVVLGDEPLAEIARRFYGDRSQVTFIQSFNHMASSRLQRGQALLLPLPDLVLHEEPVCESAAPLADANATQQTVEDQLPALLDAVTHGHYVEAVAQAARLRASPSLSTQQRVAIDRAVAEAYCALDRQDLAGDALRDALAVDDTLTFDPRTTSPKLLDALSLARGLGGAHSIAPAPPSARPDDAH